MERLVADLFFPMTQRKSNSNRLGVRAMKPGSSLKTILRWYRVFRMRTLFECLWATIRWKNWPYQFLVKNSNSMKSSSQEVFPGFDLTGHQKVYMKHDDFAWFPPVPSTTSTWNSIFHGLRQCFDGESASVSPWSYLPSVGCRHNFPYVVVSALTLTFRVECAACVNPLIS